MGVVNEEPKMDLIDKINAQIEQLEYKIALNSALAKEILYVLN